jgi:hypothetical protein
MRNREKTINYEFMKERVLPPTFNSNIPLNTQEKANQKTKDKANNHNIKNFEKVSLSHLEKYQILSQDDTTIYLHSPLKTLLVLVDFANIDCEELFKNKKLKTNSEFIKIVKEKGAELKFSELESDEEVLDNKLIFQDSLIFNDYQEFIKKCASLIEGFFN